MIVVQLLITGNLSLVAGETAILLAGGVFYLGVMIYHGLWEKGSKLKNTPFTHGMISIICAGVFCRNFSDWIFGIKNPGLSQ